MQGHLEVNDDIHCHYDHFQDRGQDLSIIEEDTMSCMYIVAG